MRLAFAFSLAVLSTLGSAQIEWENVVQWKVRAPSTITDVFHHRDGSLWVVQGQLGANLCRFDANGVRQFKVQVPGTAPVKILDGPGDDVYFQAGFVVSRIDGETGTILWSVEKGKLNAADEFGDLYLDSGDYDPITSKVSSEDGRTLFQVVGRAVVLPGPTFFTHVVGRGLVRVAKSDGSESGVVPFSSDRTIVRGAGLPNGNALLNANYRFYGYRPNGSMLNLGDATYTSEAAGNGFILTDYEKSAWMDAGFHVIWRGGELLDVDGPRKRAVFREGDSAVLVELDTGTRLASLPLPKGAAKAYFHAGRWWTVRYEPHDPDCFLDSYRLDGVRVSQERLSVEKLGAGFPLSAAVGPSGELFMHASSGYDTYLVRVSAQGTVRWSTRLNGTGGGAISYLDGTPYALTFSKDLRVGMASMRTTLGNRTFEFETSTGAIRRIDEGHGIIAGDFAYRSRVIHGKTYASKFDIETGRELWRIPRTGPIHVDDQGDVYVGNTKNRSLNGSLIWRTDADVIEVFPCGDAIIAAKRQSTTQLLLDGKTGRPRGQFYYSRSSATDPYYADWKRIGNTISFRDGAANTTVVLNALTGVAAKAPTSQAMLDASGNRYVFDDLTRALVREGVPVDTFTKAYYSCPVYDLKSGIGYWIGGENIARIRL